ncbi:MAG: hypothetical protein Q4D87_05215 [Actinomycetaceae bacterium]|nr:hypothetical protein [Actinomycetaceae bacterium]
MKKMKLAAVLAALSLTTLTACSEGASEAEPEPVETEQVETQAAEENDDEGIEAEEAALWALPEGAPDIASTKELTIAGNKVIMGSTVREVVESVDWEVDTDKEGVTIENTLALMLEPGAEETLPMRFPGNDDIRVGIDVSNETDGEISVGDAVVREFAIHHDLEDLETGFVGDPKRHEGLAKLGDAYLGMHIDDFIERYKNPEDVGGYGMTPFGTISYTYATEGGYSLNMVEFAKAEDGGFYLYSFYMRDFPDEIRQYIK